MSTCGAIGATSPAAAWDDAPTACAHVLSAAYKICPSCAARASVDMRFCANCGVDLSSVAATEGDPYLGLELPGKYMLEKLIGEGAMGQQYIQLVGCMALPES